LVATFFLILHSKNSYTIPLVIAFYMVVSIALVFQNKWLLIQFDFPFPLLITLFQLLVTCLCLILLGTVGQRFVCLLHALFEDAYQTPS
jgi:hypothetical protein